jgi:Fe-S cluster assembly iron-binding protein IscA
MLVIDTLVFERLLQLQRQLLPDGGGLRLTLAGDACSGFRVGLHWSANWQPEDHIEVLKGLRLLADARHWPVLQQATLSAGEQDQCSGIRVFLPVADCDCASQQCASSPENAK